MIKEKKEKERRGEKSKKKRGGKENQYLLGNNKKEYPKQLNHTHKTTPLFL